MYLTKQRIYLYFDKTQKSMLCTFLRAFVKQNFQKNAEDILNDFVEEQDYYLKINASRFPYLSDYLTNSNFLNETLEYIKACKKYYEYKQSQAPIIAKQKEFEKKKRKFLQEVKMSKEPPTKKQLYYYKRLCKKYNIEQKDINELSKLDVRNEIERIIDEHTGDSYNINKQRN